MMSTMLLMAFIKMHLFSVMIHCPVKSFTTFVNVAMLKAVFLTL